MVKVHRVFGVNITASFLLDQFSCIKLHYKNMILQSYYYSLCKIILKSYLKVDWKIKVLYVELVQIKIYSKHFNKFETFSQIG